MSHSEIAALVRVVFNAIDSLLQLFSLYLPRNNARSRSHLGTTEMLIFCPYNRLKFYLREGLEVHMCNDVLTKNSYLLGDLCVSVSIAYLIFPIASSSFEMIICSLVLKYLRTPIRTIIILVFELHCA